VHELRALREEPGGEVHFARLQPQARPSDVAHVDPVARIEGVGDAARRCELAVAVQIDAERPLVGRRQRHVLAFHQRLDDREIGLVDRPVGAAVLTLAERRGQADQHVVGRAVGGPERARQRHVAVGAPAVSTPVRVEIVARAVEAEIDVRSVSRPDAIAIDVPARRRLREAIEQGGLALQVVVVVGAHVAQDLGVGLPRDRRPAVDEEVRPVVDQRRLRKVVDRL
jgi:hypothetical protein